MGFGLLLLGYFTVTMASVGMGDYRFIAYLLGGMACVAATYKLKAYNPRFLLTLITSVAYLCLGVFDGLVMMDTIFLWGILPVEGVIPTVVDVATLVVNLALHVTMLWSIAELAHAVEIVKIKTRAIQNLVAIAIYAIGEEVIIAFPAVANLENQAIPRLLLLYLLVCYLLNAWLIFSCFRYICPEGEEQGKPHKPSRFAFVNKLNDKFDEKAERALREQMEYQAGKQAERERKRKKKKKK